MTSTKFATASLQSRSGAQTRQIGRQLGRCAVAGDLVCLIGDLGAGKTTLTQGIGEGLGIPAAQISSPTFTLLAEHFGGRLPLYHFDAYRLSNAADLYHLGFEDYARRADGLLVIEWADKVCDALPEDRLEVVLTDQGANAAWRDLCASSCGPRSGRLLQCAFPNKH